MGVDEEPKACMLRAGGKWMARAGEFGLRWWEALELGLLGVWERAVADDGLTVVGRNSGRLDYGLDVINKFVVLYNKKKSLNFLLNLVL